MGIVCFKKQGILKLMEIELYGDWLHLPPAFGAVTAGFAQLIVHR